MKKIVILNVILLMFLLFFTQPTFAKYTMNETLGLEVYIDKTPPTINLKSDNLNNNYNKSDLNNVIKDNKEITINTSDNIKIDYNEYYYNSTKNDFNNIVANRFESGTKISNDGYYKIITVDTSGNKTEIIVLIDKTPPEVNVKFYKKGEVAQVTEMSSRTIGGIKKNFATGNTIQNIYEDRINATTDEIKNIVEQRNAILNEEMDNNYGIMTLAVSSMTVGNEAEFRNALANRAETIYVSQSINFTSPIYISYNVKIAAASNNNALRYGSSGNFFVIQNGGNLVIDSMVLDGNSFGASGMTVINIQNGGYVTFINSSIIDGGLGNTGILINGGGSLLLWSCEIVRCNLGINLQANGNLYFATQNGRCNNFWWNTIALFIDNFYGSCDLNQNIAMYDNTNGLFTANVSGTVKVSAGNYYNNYNGINCGGSVTVTGGNYYSNNNGMCTNQEYSGRLTINNANIHSNSFSSVYHDKGGDNTCIINGGAISGQVYLAQNNNYINTNASYPKFTVTPSSYYFKRKLVKTNSNTYAKNEISNVTLTPNGSWYKYVDNEYIVIWTGGNVIVRCRDYYGNILKEEIKNGSIGTSYSISTPKISGYDLITAPTNSNGTFTANDIVVEYKFDIVNVAKITFEDLLSGVKSAKYWYNASQENFTGNGTSFENNKIFEQYGYYKIIVENNVGLTKEIIFKLDANSYTR